jgi:hypothetical protein
MDVDSDLEQLMSNIGQYCFIIMDADTGLCDRVSCAAVWRALFVSDSCKMPVLK